MVEVIEVQYDELTDEVLEHKCFRCVWGRYTGTGFVCGYAVGCAKKRREHDANGHCNDAIETD